MRQISDCLISSMYLCLMQADKGVHCPYCRQTVESYSLSRPEKMDAKQTSSDFLPEHLKNSEFALHVGGGCARGHARALAPFGRLGIVSIGGWNDYLPPAQVTGAEGNGFKANRSEESLLNGFVGAPIKPSDSLAHLAETTTVRFQVAVVACSSWCCLKCSCAVSDSLVSAFLCRDLDKYTITC